MTTAVTTVPPDLGMDRLVEDYFYQQHHRLYPVRADGRLLGYVTPQEVKPVPRADWPRRRVADVMAVDLAPVRIAAEADAAEALAQMQRTGQKRLLVMQDGSLAGMLTLTDLLHVLKLKMELEGS